jgi:DNA modification methylase
VSQLVLPPKHDHPAVFSDSLFDDLIDALTLVHPGAIPVTSVLDPFAGTGRIHVIADRAGIPFSTGIELEPEWANIDMFPAPPRMQVVGDCLDVLAGWIDTGQKVDATATSCTYGNRMADHHEAKDPCKHCTGTGHVIGDPLTSCKKCKGKGLSRRNTYRHRLGRPLTNNNTGGMQWGKKYRTFHEDVWALCFDVLNPGGRMVLNVSNHIRKHREIDVSGWHLETLERIGFVPIKVVQVGTSRNKNGANRDARVDHEIVATLIKPRRAA